MMEILFVYTLATLIIGIFILPTGLFDVFLEMSEDVMVKHIVIGILFFPMLIICLIVNIFVELLYRVEVSKSGKWISATVKKAYKPIEKFMNKKVKGR